MPTPIERAVTMESISPGVRSGVELTRAGGKFQRKQQQRIGKLKGKGVAITEQGIRSAFQSLVEQQKAFEEQQKREFNSTLISMALTAATLGFAGPIAGLIGGGLGAGAVRAAAPSIGSALGTAIGGGKVDPFVQALQGLPGTFIERRNQQRLILDILSPINNLTQEDLALALPGQRPAPIFRREQVKKELGF